MLLWDILFKSRTIAKNGNVLKCGFSWSFDFLFLAELVVLRVAVFRGCFTVTLTRDYGGVKIVVNTTAYLGRKGDKFVKTSGGVESIQIIYK